MSESILFGQSAFLDQGESFEETPIYWTPTGSVSVLRRHRIFAVKLTHSFQRSLIHSPPPACSFNEVRGKTKRAWVDRFSWERRSVSSKTNNPPFHLSRHCLFAVRKINWNGHQKLELHGSVGTTTSNRARYVHRLCVSRSVSRSLVHELRA